jgi:hypothetical protein
MEQLFNNTMVKNARNSMSPQEIENLKNRGDRMYNVVDFEKSAQTSNVDDLYRTMIQGWIQSGLELSDLSPYELELYQSTQSS